MSLMPSRLVLDLETASTLDLRLTGSHAYAEHPETRSTVVCYAIDRAPVQTWVSGPCPSDFHQAVTEGATVVAHNFMFEWNVYRHKFIPHGWPAIPLAQWSCTMARSLVAGYPASLEQISRAIELKTPKDTGARELMLRMARPRTLDPLTWWHETSPQHFERLCAYCRTDVEAERELDQLIPELSAAERAIFECDFHLNQLGIRVDEDLVRRLHDLAARSKIKATHELALLTEGAVRTPNQVAVLKAWLAQQGVELEDLRRPTVLGALAGNHLAAAPRKALQTRLDASRSSTAKLTAILQARSQDGRVHGAFQYYGASRTGRWAGRRLQPQNLFRGSIKDVDAAVFAILRRDATPEDLDMLFEDTPLGVIASCLRSTIQAPDGHRLVVMDFSQIEARVLAWLADEQASLDCFRRGDDIYVETANRIGSTSRQLGKVLVLACGFGMGPYRFQQTAAGYGLTLTTFDCEDLVYRWREANANIVQFWWDCERAVHTVCQAPIGTAVKVGKITYIRRPNALLCRLPSGRHLVYRRPTIQWNPENMRRQYCYFGSFGGNWVQQRAWPGKLVENVTQAAARDVLAGAMVELYHRGVPLVATVHDELIAEVPQIEAEHTFTLMQQVMRRTPDWAPGLPMDANGFIAQRYAKK